eukprot:PhM_4_TR767/c0_g1_i1/m.35375/K17790/TIM22; mitochondrial import inner membrane translocase subunit TIM22
MTLLIEIPQLDAMSEALTTVRETSVTMGLGGAFGGYVMGWGFSMFSAMISVETTTQSMGMRDLYRYTLRTAHRSGVGFASFGLMFGAVEVALEKRRGCKDHWNPATSGAMLGGYYGWKSYRHLGLTGGIVGGAIFTVLFEKMISMLMGTPMHPTY